VNPGNRDEIVRALHANHGLWRGKINNYQVTLLDWRAFPDYPRKIIWRVTRGRATIAVGEAQTIWKAIDAIESLS